MIGLDVIDQLTGGRPGTCDVPCPLCGPFKRAVRNQRRPVLRIYRIEPGFAGFHCARCGQKGAAFDRSQPSPDPIKVAKARADAAERDYALKAERRGKAQWLWSQRMPIAGSIAEAYLRRARSYEGPFPATLGFLPARGKYPPAMIGAFGLAHEIGPGEISIADSAVRGVHLTRLLPDGSAKAVFEDPDEQAKIMIGHSAGFPIVLASMNDGLALGITEGLEDGLSIRQSLGIGVWTAGAASRLSVLAEIVPDYTDTVPIFAHDDRDGQHHAAELGRRLRARSIDVKVVTLGCHKATA
jgi:hypothetical protein